MSFNERVIHRFLISCVFTIFNWIIVDNFLIEIPLWKYLIIELFLVISLKFYTFTIRKIKL